MTPRPASASAQTAEAERLAAGLELVELRVSHDSLASALVAALEDLTIVKTGRTVTVKTKAGPDFSYDYADLGDVVKLTRPTLWKHGLVALTPVHDHGDGLACTVTILHESGQQMDMGPFPFPHGRDAQATGSMVTYHRRYALVAALGMAAGDDDDGAAAQPRQAEPPRTLSPKAQAKNVLLELCEGDKERAAAAWAGIGGDVTEWDGASVGLLQRRYEEWVNQPKDDPAPPADGDVPGDEGS